MPLLGSLKLQVEEIDALQCMYPDEVHMDPDELVALHDARELASSGNDVTETELTEALPSLLAFRVQLADNHLEGAGVELAVVLPRSYPDEKPTVKLEVKGAHVTRALASALHVAASDAVSECWCPGEGCLLALVGVAQSVLQDRADELSEMMASMRRTTGEETSSRDFAVDAERTLGRKLIWFHHIKNPLKRKNIVSWARELSLGGFSKPGYPGVVVVEGPESGCVEYVWRLRQLSWKAMQVRDEETEDCGDSLQEARRLPDSFVELAESGLGELSEACVKAGLANLVVAALKLNPESAGVVKKVEAESTRN